MTTQNQPQMNRRIFSQVALSATLLGGSATEALANNDQDVQSQDTSNPIQDEQSSYLNGQYFGAGVVMGGATTIAVLHGLSLIRNRLAKRYLNKNAESLEGLAYDTESGFGRIIPLTPLNIRSYLLRNEADGTLFRADVDWWQKNRSEWLPNQLLIHKVAEQPMPHHIAGTGFSVIKNSIEYIFVNAHLYQSFRKEGVLAEDNLIYINEHDDIAVFTADKIETRSGERFPREIGFSAQEIDLTMSNESLLGKTVRIPLLHYSNVEVVGKVFELPNHSRWSNYSQRSHPQFAIRVLEDLEAGHIDIDSDFYPSHSGSSVIDTETNKIVGIFHGISHDHLLAQKLQRHPDTILIGFSGPEALQDAYHMIKTTQTL